MITAFVDEVIKASAEACAYLEEQVSAIALPPGFRQGYGQEAAFYAKKITQESSLSTKEILQVAALVEKQKKQLNRKEFGSFVRDMLGWTTDTARKYLNIAKTFATFPNLDVLSRIEPFMLLRLCGKKYTAVVERLREGSQLNQLDVGKLIEELVPKTAKKKKESVEYGDAVLQRHPNTEDGTFYFTLKEVNLNDKTGLWLEEKLASYTVGQLLEQAAEW